MALYLSIGNMGKSIKDLLKFGEGSSLEFKKTITHPEKIAKTITAFANSGGGTLLIGIDDDKRIIGIQPDEEIFMLDKASDFYSDPPVAFNAEPVEIDDKTILQVIVPESPSKPHACQDIHGEWKYYIRSGDKCLIVSKTVVGALSGLAGQQIPKRAFTKNEQLLFDFLKKNNQITAKDFAKLINIGFRRAQRILIELVRDGYISEHDFNKTNFYTLLNPNV